MRILYIIRFIASLSFLLTHVTGYSIRSELSYNTTAIENVVIHTPSQRVYPSANFNISFTLQGDDRPFKFTLKPNHDILLQDPHISFIDGDGRARRRDILRRDDHRVFKGAVLAESATHQWGAVGWARITVVRDGADPLFDGAFSISGVQYHVKVTSGLMVVSHAYQDDNRHDLRQLHPLNPLQERQFTFGTGDLADTIGSTNGCPSARRIALVGIATDCSYTAAFDSSEDLVQTIVTMVNTASEVFENQFNIALSLHNLTIEDATCPNSPSSNLPWNAPCSAGDMSWRLQTFSAWRASLGDDENAYWTLMSGCPTGSEVGISWVGALCNTETGANVVALVGNQWQVFAHESAHTFGAYHDCDSSTCSNGQQCCPLSASTCNAGGEYLMNPISTSPQREFSPCTVGNVCSAMGSGRVRTSCLTTNTNTPTITAGECGNGVLEAGEECDCGDDCDGNSCCDGSTCRFIGDAVCDDAAGPCCTDCQFASSSTVCRESIGGCDIEETCTGNSSACPSDRHRPDGQSCGDGDGLFCSSGQCTSRDLQCREQFNVDNSSSNVVSCGGNGTCVLECSRSWTGSGSCSRVGNVLDGAPCEGGLCRSGECQRSRREADDGEESWVQRNLSLVIGLSAGIGGALLLAVLSCIIYCCCCRRRPKTVPLPSQVPLPPVARYPHPQTRMPFTGTSPPPYYRYA